MLTARIAHLIHAHGVQPWQVLAITFTNKASGGGALLLLSLPPYRAHRCPCLLLPPVLARLPPPYTHSHVRSRHARRRPHEMRERLSGMLGGGSGAQLFAGTFHSLCYRILKRDLGHLEGAGRTQAFTVYDQVGVGGWVGGGGEASHPPPPPPPPVPCFPHPGLAADLT